MKKSCVHESVFENLGKFHHHIKGDCLEVIPTLEDDSIQLVITSPPYFNSEKKYQRGIKWGEKSEIGIHNSVPVGEPLFDILEVMELLKPKVKDGGFVCLNLGFSYSEGKVNRVGELIRQIERRTHWYNIDRIFWHKTNPIPLQKRLSNSVETIEVFTKHPLAKYPKDIKYEHNFIETPVATSHKNQSHKPFPKEIPRKCIDIFSKEDDLVVDCFEGSGTSGIVCLDMNRKYIGIEIA
jgi:site-specific DNA-methyltransferase (adenine-specific)